VQGTDKAVYQAARLNFVAGTAGTFETAAKMTGVSVSPNPANESMKVEFNTVESEKMTFVVVDMMGNKVASMVSQSNVGTNAVEVNTSKLATGVYHLMVFDSKNSAHVEKIAVQH
jgi:copper(I)-binding protein